MTEQRTVCLYSHGAASTVATRLMLKEGPAVVVNNHVVEEHPDNARFLADCEKWCGQKFVVQQNEKYNGSIYEVFRRERFLVGHRGAPCTKHLKRGMNEKFIQPGDVVVLGFTAEEVGRYERFKHLFSIGWCNEVRAPLIERGLTKADCLAMIERAGIELPAMYRLGFRNNNCRGCVKGGKGYWNKVRKVFPEFFERMARMQDELGAGSHFWRDDTQPEGRLGLRALHPDAGRDDEPEIECGIFCAMAEQELAD